MNKKINQLDSRVPSLTDLILSGDSSLGTSYKSLVSDLITLAIPIGGTAGQILAKVNSTNFNTEWIDNYTSSVKHIVKAGVAVTKGNAVYISSADGTNMIVSKASNVNDALSATTIGIVAETLAINGQGFVITEGLLAGLNTSTATIGDPIWLGVDGALIFGLVNKPVAPAHLVYLGTVTRVHAVNGEIFVNVSNGWELEELHDVLITSPITGQLLRRDSDNLWKNWTPNYLTISSAASTYQTLLSGSGIVKSTAGTITYLADNSSNWNSAYSFTSSFPSQTGNAGKYLTTDGTSLSWASVASSGVTSFNTRTGAITLTSLDVTTSLGYTPVTNARTLTINGTTYDLSADRSWTVSGTNIYSSDGTLTSARTLTLSTFSLTIAGTTSSRFHSNGRVTIGTVTDGGFLFDVVGSDARINTIKIGLGGGAIATNIGIGYQTLISNSTGLQNTFIGYNSGRLSDGSRNTAIGAYSMELNTSGTENNAFGRFALGQNTTGNNNQGIGHFALYSNTTASSNTAIGDRALFNVQTSGSNTAIGYYAAFSYVGTVDAANKIVAIGENAARSNTTGGFSTIIGSGSMYNTSTGAYNTAIGHQAMYPNTTGSNNIAIGYRAGWFTNAGTDATVIDNSILIGYNAKVNASSQTNQIVIGYNETGLGSNTTIIGNSSTILTALRGSVVIGATLVNASALFQIDSTTKGALFPRMTTTQKNAISSPANGLVIFDTTLNKLCVYTTTWETITSV